MIPNTEYIFNLKKANKIYQRVQRALSIDDNKVRKFSISSLAEYILHWNSVHASCACDDIDDLAKLVYSGTRRTHVIYRVRCAFCNGRFTLFHYWSNIYDSNKDKLKQKPVSKDILKLIAPSTKDYIYLLETLSSLAYCYQSYNKVTRYAMCPEGHGCDKRKLFAKAKELRDMACV